MRSRARSPQNVRVAARSRISSARAEKLSPAPEDWVPAALRSGSPKASAVINVEAAEAVPAEPAAAAELGSEVQRLRRELGNASQRADAERQRDERAESEAAELREPAEQVKRAAARGCRRPHGDGSEDPDGALDLNSASFEALRAVGLTVTQAARVIGQRKQHGGFASVDDVDAIVGIPKNLKETLEQQGSV